MRPRTARTSATTRTSAIAIAALILGCQPAPVPDRPIEEPAAPPCPDLDSDGFRSCEGDCDDASVQTSPGATEICDLLDNDCDGLLAPFEADADLDGWPSCMGDCDDDAPLVYPGADEVCDGVDNDCDFYTDESPDADNDGFTVCDGDCNDSECSVHPQQPERCEGLDTDCDPATSEDTDADGDGFTLCEGDCDDEDPNITLGEPEVCNALDEDCDGQIDEDFDADGDGFTTCGADLLLGNLDDDCDDADPLRNPGADEVAGDGVDSDCDEQDAFCPSLPNSEPTLDEILEWAVPPRTPSVLAALADGLREAGWEGAQTSIAPACRPPSSEDPIYEVFDESSGLLGGVLRDHWEYSGDNFGAFSSLRHVQIPWFAVERDGQSISGIGEWSNWSGSWGDQSSWHWGGWSGDGQLAVCGTTADALLPEGVTIWHGVDASYHTFKIGDDTTSQGEILWRRGLYTVRNAFELGGAQEYGLSKHGTWTVTLQGPEASTTWTLVVGNWLETGCLSVLDASGAEVRSLCSPLNPYPFP